MKKIDDRRIYLSLGIVALAISIIVGAISYYSILVVEPRVDRLLSAADNIHEKYRDAFKMLDKEQLFARYQHFDSKASTLPKTIVNFRRKIFNGEEFISTDMRQLENLLERRMQGSRLGRYTMFFFLLLSAVGWIMFFYEKHQVAKSE